MTQALLAQALTGAVAGVARALTGAVAGVAQALTAAVAGVARALTGLVAVVYRLELVFRLFVVLNALSAVSGMGRPIHQAVLCTGSCFTAPCVRPNHPTALGGRAPQGWALCRHSTRELISAVHSGEPP